MKNSIARRVFLLVMSGSILSLIVLGLAMLWGAAGIRDKVIESGEHLGEHAAGFTENIIAEQVKKRVSAIALAKAQRIDRELEITAEDVQYLSDLMTAIMNAPDEYPARILPTPQRDTISSGQAYINYSRRLAADGVSGGLLREMRLSANIADAMAAMGKKYSANFAGSKHGYLIAVDVTADGGAKQFSPQFLESYDPREMIWYKRGAASEKPTFTWNYVDTNGMQSLTCAMPYYADGEIAGVVGIDCNPGKIYRQATADDAELGNRIGSFVLNSSGAVIFSTRGEGILSVRNGESASDAPADLRQAADQRLALEVARMVEGKRGVQLVTVDGEEYYLAYAPMRSIGWSLGMIVGKTDVVYPTQYARDNIMSQMHDFTGILRELFIKVAQGAIFLLLLLLAALFFICRRASGRFARPIRMLTDSVREIAKGNLDKKLDLKTGDEVEELSESINHMTGELKKYMANLALVSAEKERIATELSVATNIQAGMLPNIFPAYPEQREFDIFASMIPAKEVGGDFYDFYLIDKTHLAVTIADVSGKGVPAALFMVIAKTILKNCVMMAKDMSRLAEAMEKTNDQLCQGNEESMFVTVFLGVLDIESGEFAFVNGGHNPPFLRTNGKFQSLALQKSCMLGAMEGVTYRAQSLTMQPGDMLFLYTDGVTEAQNMAGGMYSEARLLDVLNREPKDRDAKGVLAAVQKSVADYAGEAEQFDDITMLGLIYKGSGSQKS